MKDKFCSFCGTEHSNNTSYPKKCNSCNRETFNPVAAVAIGAICLYDEDIRLDSVIITKRAIHPIGGLCFTGGYIEQGETWREALSRETWEEANIVIDPEKWGFVKIGHSTHGAHMIAVGRANILYEESLPIIEGIKSFKRNDETLEVYITREVKEMCFPMHSELLRNILKEKELK